MSLTPPRFDPPELGQPPEALAGLEISGIARGLVAVDALVKKAASRVVLANTVTPGKFLILLDGAVAEVEESLLAAEAIAGDQVVDRLFLPHVHPQIEPLIFGRPGAVDDMSMGLVECSTTCSGIRAADAALKAAETRLLVIHLSAGIGGKCYFALSGDLYDIEAAVEAAGAAAGDGRLLGVEIIANPHPEFLAALGIGQGG